jgi:hypothetical protein
MRQVKSCCSKFREIQAYVTCYQWSSYVSYSEAFKGRISQYSFCGMRILCAPLRTISTLPVVERVQRWKNELPTYIGASGGCDGEVRSYSLKAMCTQVTNCVTTILSLHFWLATARRQLKDKTVVSLVCVFTGHRVVASKNNQVTRMNGLISHNNIPCMIMDVV